MYLQHLHLTQPISYRLASAIQEILVRGKIDYSLGRKAEATTGPGAALARDAAPSLLTFVAQPTYTSGRRQKGLSAQQIYMLEHGSSSASSTASPDAVYVPSPRGGLLTFHGPGQVTAYAMVHLRTHGLTPRCYVRTLETSILQSLKRYGIEGFTRDEYPGVWITPDQKLASIGVHVRRGVTCFGAGINVATDPKWWQRFTACGIDGVQMVNMRDCGANDASTADVGTVLAECLARELKGVEAVQAMQHDEAGSLYDMAKERMEQDAME